ncbi:MAG: mechanosensitive ion channel family protein [Pseudomonadota bacterium]
MNTYIDLLKEYLAHPLVIAIIIVLLIGYRYASSRLKQLPSVPVGLLILYLFLCIILNTIPEIVGEGLLHWLDVITVIVLYCAAVRILFAFTVEFWLAWRRKTTLPKLTRDVILLAIYAVITFVVLRTRGGVNLAGLLTTSAVLTAIVGLSAQNTLGSLFAGLSLQLERPYSIGDWIQFGNSIGRVVGIGWKSTRLVTFENELIFVPNLDIVKTEIKNFSRPTKKIWMKIDLGVEYPAAPNKVRSVLLDVLREDSRVLMEPKPTVRLTNYGDFAITYQIRFLYDDYGNYPDLRAAIMNNVWYALRRNNIRIPFPIRDVHHRHIERKFEHDMVSKERADATAEINSVPIFEPLSHEARGQLAEHVEIVHYGNGEDVVRQDDQGDSMFILHKGLCDVLLKKGDAPPIAVAELKPSSFFGEMSLLTGEARTATVRAKGDSTLFKIDKELFAEVLAADESVSEKLAEALATRQAEMAEVLGKQLLDKKAQASKMVQKIKAFFGIR